VSLAGRYFCECKFLRSITHKSLEIRGCVTFLLILVANGCKLVQTDEGGDDDLNDEDVAIFRVI